MASLNPIITSGGKERLSAFVNLYTQAFATDPCIIYMLCGMPTEAERLAYLPQYLHTLVKAAALNGATFDEIGGYESCAIFMPPGRKVDNVWTLVPAGFFGCLWRLGVGGCQRMLFEYTKKSNAAKAKVLAKGEKFYYVWFIATREDCRGRGLASTLIKHYQTIARKAGKAIWLESTTASSREVYLKVGFEVVEEIVLGKGRAAADGTGFVGGEGVKVWGMVWRPEKEEK